MRIFEISEFCADLPRRFFFKSEKSPFAVFMGCCKTIERYLCFSFLPGLCIRSLQMQLKTARDVCWVCWCVVVHCERERCGNAGAVCVFPAEKLRHGTQSCAKQSVATPYRLQRPGAKTGEGEVNCQTPSHQSLQPGEAQEAKPADPLQGSDPSMPFS